MDFSICAPFGCAICILSGGLQSGVKILTNSGEHSKQFFEDLRIVHEVQKVHHLQCRQCELHVDISTTVDMSAGVHDASAKRARQLAGKYDP